MSGTTTGGGEAAAEPVIAPELLEILACPIDKSPVKLVGDRLVCEEQLRFGRHRGGDADPLQFAARHLVRILAQPSLGVTEPDFGE